MIVLMKEREYKSDCTDGVDGFIKYVSCLGARWYIDVRKQKTKLGSKKWKEMDSSKYCNKLNLIVCVHYQGEDSFHFNLQSVWLFNCSVICQVAILGF